jgi:hypothetical protein
MTASNSKGCTIKTPPDDAITKNNALLYLILIDALQHLEDAYEP